MTTPFYPSGTVQALLDSEAVTEPTRQVLKARLKTSSPPQFHFFSPDEQKTLQAVCIRLIPQTDQEHPIELTACIDNRLAEGKGDGWRYNTMPPDGEAYRLGLDALNQSAIVRHSLPFEALTTAQQDAILQAVKEGTVEGEIWQSVSPARFFEELLTEVVENYYAHPWAQEEIGYVGFADAPGWHHIRLNEREVREPSSVTPQGETAQKAPTTTTTHKNPTAPPAPLPSITLAQMSRYAPFEVVDAVVIGTGAGGAPLLARLAQAGLKVVALEAGPYWNPQEFATDEKSQSKLFWIDERLSAGADPLAFGNNNSGTGVGGSTLHFTAYTPRAHADNFKIHTEFGVGRDWPLSYADLEPYYDEIEQFLGISGPTPYPWGEPRHMGYPLPSLPLNGAAQLMQRGCADLGIRTSPAANAALSAPYFQPGVGWRPACTNRGFCQAGCSTGAKASMDVTYIPLAIGAGAEVRPNCFVTQIETDKTSRVTGVAYYHEGREERQKCKVLFLCGGAIETPRLLLMNGLANGSGQVGRNFMAHPALQIWGQFEEAVHPYKGIPASLISEDTRRPQGKDWGKANFASGYLLQSIGVMPVTYVSQLARGRGLWNQELRDHMRGYNHTAGINILGECLPHPNNFLELSDERDGRGLPKPRIHFSKGDNEKRLTAHAENLMRQIWATAGAHDIWAFPRNSHIIGTCVMGNNPENSVVDANARSFEIPNLFICDNSIFPSSLTVNPSLTIMALSLCTADRFLQNLPQRH